MPPCENMSSRNRPDQGTTSTRAILFRADTSIAAFAQQEFPQHFPADGEVEHEPEDLWATTLATCRERHARSAGASARDIVAIGIANQRETTLLWDRATGRPFIARSSGRTGAPPACARA
jgi:glycerol kinase